MPYRVIEEWDGCPMRDLTRDIPTLTAAKRTIRELMRPPHNFKLDRLMLVDTSTGRAVSFVLERR